MGADAKQIFIDQLVEAMAEELTVKQAGILRKAAAGILDGFRMTELRLDGDGDDLLDVFIAAKEVQCLSQKSIDRYRIEIQKMLDFVKVPTRRITVNHLREYLADGRARGLKETTLEGQREILQGFFNWLQREALIEHNPTTNLGAIKCAKTIRKSYSKVELEKLNQCCKTLRDRAIISFLAATGCRISEMIGLDRDAVDFAALECIVHGKGNKERTVYLNEVAGMLLKEYLDNRTDDLTALFISKKKNRLTSSGVRKMLHEVAERANVENVHPHRFRRTLAMELTRHGMPVQEVAEILGHEKLDTTMKYVVRYKEDVKHDYRRYA